MPIRAKENLIGAWALLIGVVLAIVGGIVLSFGYSINPIILAILTLLGIVAGFSVNVSESGSQNGSQTFLMAAVSLVIVSFAGIQSSTALAGTQFAEVQIIGIQVGRIMAATLSGLLFILIPATIIVAIKSVFSIAQR